VTLAPSSTHAGITAAGGVLEVMRDRTRETHARLEARLLLLDPALDMARYRAVLAAFYGYHASLEPRLWSVPGLERLGLHAAERRKAPLLERDLLLLGFDTDAVAALPRCAALPPVADLGSALGALYVLEGATLGGRVITRHLSAHLRIGASTGGAFFEGYGERTGDMWRAYRAAVHRAVLDPECGVDEVAAVTAAVATFDALDRWFQHAGAVRV